MNVASNTHQREFLHQYARARAHVMGFDMNSIKKMCGAKTRQGTPCKNTRLYKNGRCKNHGGLSTGPRTEEGKARALENLKKPKKKNEFLKQIVIITELI
jgi:hypothetical protein